MKTTIMKPGILVSLKTELHGGVVYERRDLDSKEPTTIETARERYKALRDAAPDREAFEMAFRSVCAPKSPSDLNPVQLIAAAEKAAGLPQADVTRWETTRVVEDPGEHDRAVKARGKARSLIAAHCTPTSFGLLCPLEKEGELDAAIREARGVVDAFNEGAQRSHVGVYVLKGRIAETDEEATRAIASEVRGLLDAMEKGIRNVNAKAVREAASKAKAMGAMLDESKQIAVSRAIETARKAAREIVKRVDKGGEDASVVLEEIATKPIESARFAFLDLDGEAEPSGEAMPAVSVQRIAGLDLN
jgi:hypothetical protein